MRYVPYDPAPASRPPRAAMAVRVATELSELVACAKLAAEYNDEDHRTSLVNLQRHVGRPRNAVHIAVNMDDEVLGYGRTTWIFVPSGAPANVSPMGYYLGGLIVASQHRRRGVGARLTAERMRFIARHSADAWYLVNQHNSASIALHDAYGFHETTRDFVFPGVVLDEPGGILGHARLRDDAAHCQGCPD